MKTAVFGRQVEFRLKQADLTVSRSDQALRASSRGRSSKTSVCSSGWIIQKRAIRISSKRWSRRGLDVQFVSEVRHSLEDVYLSLINNGNNR